MSICKNTKILTMIALTCALSACLPASQQPVSVANDSQTIVTPWGTTSNAQANAVQPMASTPGATTDNLVMMKDPNRAMLGQMQQQQLDEARIALGILDRMAQRCVQQGDAASCVTLQQNWEPLSQQLHKSLSVLSGDNMNMNMNMNMPIADPTINNAPRQTLAPQQPAPRTVTVPQGLITNGTTSLDATETPQMEKVIPMIQPGTDG